MVRSDQRRIRESVNILRLIHRRFESFPTHHQQAVTAILLVNFNLLLEFTRKENLSSFILRMWCNGNTRHLGWRIAVRFRHFQPIGANSLTSPIFSISSASMIDCIPSLNQKVRFFFAREGKFYQVMTARDIFNKRSRSMRRQHNGKCTGFPPLGCGFDYHSPLHFRPIQQTTLIA